MDGVESPQRAALSKVSGALRDLRRQLDHDEMSEIAIECGNSTSERRACHARLAPTARERGRAKFRLTSGGASGRCDGYRMPAASSFLAASRRSAALTMW